MSAPAAAVEQFTDDECAFLSSYVTNTELPVFALVNLPEAVKGALFARYSRSHKSLRRLLLDEFRDDLDHSSAAPYVQADGDTRAGRLYDKVFVQYGDDSVAQLGSAHIACEQVSNLLTKVLERGRLMSYLEQSTRYIPFDKPLNGRWRYYMPDDLPGGIDDDYATTLDTMFESYSEAKRFVTEHLTNTCPCPDGESHETWERTLRARALDATRGMLPAATLSNVGIHGSGQAFEHLVLRLLSSHLSEARAYGEMMLVELRKVIPEFLRRVDQPEYGGRAQAYHLGRRERLERAAQSLKIQEGCLSAQQAVEHNGASVLMLDCDQFAERRVLAAALWPHLGYSEADVRHALIRATDAEVQSAWDAIKGDRMNRRHRPGRELEAVGWRFEVISDFGAYRDLQRHRMQTVEAQPLGIELGYVTPGLIIEAGARSSWLRGIEASERLHQRLLADSPEHASYPVSMAHRIRYVMDFNAREAMHIIELRSQPQGHPTYRSIVQEMLRQIRDIAGTHRIADLFEFADMSDGADGRLKSEQRTARRQRG